MAAAYGVLPEILKEKGMSLSCLRQLSIKLSNSVSLPFYSRLSLREIEAWKNKWYLFMYNKLYLGSRE